MDPKKSKYSIGNVKNNEETKKKRLDAPDYLKNQ
jgi:hypothetical protein